MILIAVYSICHSSKAALIQFEHQISIDLLIVSFRAILIRNSRDSLSLRTMLQLCATVSSPNILLAWISFLSKFLQSSETTTKLFLISNLRTHCCASMIIVGQVVHQMFVVIGKATFSVLCLGQHWQYIGWQPLDLMKPVPPTLSWACQTISITCRHDPCLSRISWRASILILIVCDGSTCAFEASYAHFSPSSRVLSPSFPLSPAVADWFIYHRKSSQQPHYQDAFVPVEAIDIYERGTIVLVHCW